MNKLINFLKIFLIGLIYWPCILIWAIIGGIIGGIVFKIWATWEEYWGLVWQEIREWKRYPGLYYNKYIQRLMNTRYRDPKYRIHRLTIPECKKRYPNAPFPFNIVIINFVILLFFLSPLRCISGIFQAPVIILSDGYMFWERNIMKRYPQNKYEKLLELIRKRKDIESNEFKTTFARLLLFGGF